MAQVVRLRREKGKVVQDCDVYIGRALYQGGWKLPKSKWFNPYKVGADGTREEVIAKYEIYLKTRPDLMASLPELKGKVLGCWCKPQACHGDVLVRLVSDLSSDQS